MPNNTRTQNDATWVNGYEPPREDWEDLDRKIFGSWNGDKGGVYCAPYVNGSRYVFGGTGGLQVQGPTRLTYGGAIYAPASGFIIRDGAWPKLSSTHAGATRKIVQPIEQYHTQRHWLWTRRNHFGLVGVGSTALACRLTSSREIETSDLYVPLRVIDGSTLKSVELNFRVASRRIYAPHAMPKMRVLRVPKNSGGNFGETLPEPLKKTSDGLGFDFTPLVTTPDAWYNEGKVQSFTYVCDQNHVIDVENYSYVVHIVEEQGALTPEDEFDGIRFAERKNDVAYVVANTDTDLSGSGALETDGDITFSGLRMLVIDPPSLMEDGVVGYSAIANGIYTLNIAGAWTRAPDLDATEDFSPNWIVIANTSKKWRCSTFQCQFPSSATRVDVTSSAAASRTRISITPAYAKGNIYHSLVPTFAVSDLRFQ